MERFAENLIRPDYSLGVERLANAGQMAKGGKVERLHYFITCLHERPYCGGSGIPDCNPVLFREAVLCLCRKAGVKDALGYPKAPRTDDAVRCARDPSGVSGAPVDVVISKVEDPLCCKVLGNK